MAGAPGRGGNAETLRKYWAEGEGAAKIRWGDPGDFDRCVNEVNEYMPGRAKGYCNLLHKRALGYYPATHAKMGASNGSSETWEPAVTLALGFWDETLHPRIPAGQPGGGKFATGSKTGGAGGKGGKGAKGGKKGAAAAKKAQMDAAAKGAYAKLQGMTPEARAKALAGLTDPQLKALAKVASQGNSNDPVVKAIRTAIADEAAKRSLTGTKGPSQVKAERSARAKASADKKAASAKTKAEKATASATKKAAADKTRAAKASAAQAKRDTAAKAKAAKATTPSSKRSTATPGTTAPKGTTISPNPAANGRAQRVAAVRTLAAALAKEQDPAKKRVLRQKIRQLRGGPRPVGMSHVALASPAVTSGDGPAVTVNADTKDPAAAKACATAIKDKVAAYAKVPADQRDAYRRRVIASAKQCGCINLIPKAWLSGMGGAPAGIGGGS